MWRDALRGLPRVLRKRRDGAGAAAHRRSELEAIVGVDGGRPALKHDGYRRLCERGDRLGDPPLQRRRTARKPTSSRSLPHIGDEQVRFAGAAGSAPRRSSSGRPAARAMSASTSAMLDAFAGGDVDGPSTSLSSSAAKPAATSSTCMKSRICAPSLVGRLLAREQLARDVGTRRRSSSPGP